ncbi:MAG: nitroreductase family deazaflavin-dependent oxidoreductase [Anaerolineales bacterium]
MNSLNERNATIIDEFRANAGHVGGPYTDRSLLLLHTIGAKTGQKRVNPVVYITDGDRFVILASKAGAPTNPDWYHNLLAHPLVTVEVGAEQFQVKATVSIEPERGRLFNKMVEASPGFADYQRKTTRLIPVIVLTRVN